MLYWAKMTMPIDLAIGEVGRQRPDVHCPVEYVEWLIPEPEPILRKLLNRRREAMARPVVTLVFNVATGFGEFILQSVVVNFAIKIGGPGWCWLKLVLSRRIQCHAGAKPEIVRVHKLMPYQPDFGEELKSWLRDEESGGCRAKGTQTPMPVLPETSPEVAGKTTEVHSSPHDPGPESYSGTDSEDKPSESVAPPRRGNRPCQEQDRYPERRSVRSVRETTDGLIPSLLLLVGLLLVVIAMSNPDMVVMAVVAVAANVSMFSPQLMPPWTRWWASHC